MSWCANDDRRSTDDHLAHDVLPSPEEEARRRTDCRSDVVAEAGAEIVEVAHDVAAMMS